MEKFRRIVHGGIRPRRLARPGLDQSDRDQLADDASIRIQTSINARCARTSHAVSLRYREVIIVKSAAQRKATAVKKSLDFLNTGFLLKAKKELERIGFISDEHGFAPYGDELSKGCERIDSELPGDFV